MIPQPHNSLDDLTIIEVSIVIEWENVLLSELDRTFLMLKQLKKQILEFTHTVEVIVLFNIAQIERKTIEAILKENLYGDSPELTHYFRLIETENSHYFDLKNIGATHAKGEIVVLLDSDVIPEANWLNEITRLFFENKEVRAVAGHTYLTCNTFIGKAFALGWIFPIHQSKLEVHSNYKYFKANNIAFRREVFLDYPFPKLPSGVTRGACRKLGETLHESNITLWTNTGAQANHPPPSNFEHFKMRALAHGRDKILGRKIFGLSFLGAIASLFFWVGKRIFINLVKIVSKNREVNLPIWQTPFAFGTMICFYLLSLVGGFISIFFPQYALKHWQI